jgi:hypothetical protein
MRFFRHFQRMWPRFFQTRELRFIQSRPKWRGVVAALYKGSLKLVDGDGPGGADRPATDRYVVRAACAPQ